MKKSTRILLGFIVVETLLGGLWYVLASNGRDNPDRVSADYQVVLGETMGQAMGGVGALLLVLFVVALLKERKGAA